MKRRPVPVRLTALVLPGCVALAVAGAGCGQGPPAGSRPGPTGPARTATTTASPTPAGSGQPGGSCAARVLAGMSLAQRAGQLFIAGLPGGTLSRATAATLTRYHVGSVQFITTSTAGTAGVRAVTRSVQALASIPATGGVRFLVAANQEGGQVQTLQGPGFSAIPAAVAQGRMKPAVLQQQATAWGLELRSAGVNLDFAPVMDVVPPGTASQNQPIGALDREYGSDAAAVAAHGTAFIRGMMRAGVAVTAKHFPGLGRVRGNTDFSAGVADTVTTGASRYLRPFRAAIAAGAQFVMVALATYTRIDARHLAVFSPAVLRGLLRGRLGFRGVIVSDDLGSAVAVAHIPPASRAARFLAAGGDLVTSKFPGTAVAMERGVLARARTDPGFRRTVDAAALRVLTAKQAYGLLPCG